MNLTLYAVVLKATVGQLVWGHLVARAAGVA